MKNVYISKELLLYLNYFKYVNSCLETSNLNTTMEESIKMVKFWPFQRSHFVSVLLKEPNNVGSTVLI